MPMDTEDLSAHWRDITQEGSTYKNRHIKYLMDWIRLFPGVSPSWAPRDWLLAKYGILREVPEDHVWDETIRQAGRHLLNFLPRDTAEGFAPEKYLDDYTRTEEELRAPPPGDLYEMVNLATGMGLKVDLRPTFRETHPIIYFEAVTGIVARLAGAEEAIYTQLHFGNTNRSHFGRVDSSKFALFVRDEGADSPFAMEMDSLEMVREWLPIKMGRKAYPYTIERPVPGLPAYGYGARVAIKSEEVAAELAPKLRPVQVMAKALPKRLWEIYNIAYQHSHAEILVLVEGVFVLFTGLGDIWNGCSYEWFNFFDARPAQLRRTMQNPKGGLPPHRIWSGEGADRPGRGPLRDSKVFEEIITNGIREVYIHQAVVWNMLDEDRANAHSTGVIEYLSAVEGLSVDEVIDKLKANLHARAVAAFAPEEA